MNVYACYYLLINWCYAHSCCPTFTVPQLTETKEKLIANGKF